MTKEIEQKVKLELENQKTQEKLNAFEASGVEETKAPSSLSKKLNVISGQTFGMLPQGSKRQSKNLSGGTSCYQEPKLTFRIQFHAFRFNADYLRQVEPRTDSRAVRALLRTGGSRIKKSQRHYVEVYGPYQVMFIVDGISIYSRTYVTTDSDQIGQIYWIKKNLKYVKSAMTP